MLHRERYQQIFSPEMIQFLNNIPYDITKDSLYSTEEMMAGYDPERPESLQLTFHAHIFRYYKECGRNTQSFEEKWAQNCHDAAISNALNRMLADYDPRKIVGIMGGHELSRKDDAYRKIACTAKMLTEMGWLVTSGGGPGAMEATHFGAWMAGRTKEEFDEAFSMLSVAEYFYDEKWMKSEWEVYHRFPQKSGFKSIAIPTWVFGREPPIMFATHIAEFFSNSIREDSLITIPFGGILFLPGSAGTFREIFQDIVQNHYLTWKYPSPMVFVGKDYWTKKIPLYPMFQSMLKSRGLKNLLSALVDNIDEIIDIISDFENLYDLIISRQQKVAANATDSSRK